MLSGLITPEHELRYRKALKRERERQGEREGRERERANCFSTHVNSGDLRQLYAHTARVEQDLLIFIRAISLLPLSLSRGILALYLSGSAINGLLIYAEDICSIEMYV